MNRDGGAMPDPGHTQRNIPDMDAPIVPGECAAGILVGSRFDLAPEDGETYQIETGKDSMVYSWQSVKVWTRDGVVYQVGVYEGYRGTLSAGIGIGSTISEVEDRCRCEVIEGLDGDLETPRLPGWSFDTTEWKGSRKLDDEHGAVRRVRDRGFHVLNDNRDATITVICVFKPPVDHA